MSRSTKSKMAVHTGKVWSIMLLLLSFTVPFSSAAELRVVPTFESAGLYWKPSTNDGSAACELRYRVAGTTDWQEGFPLWFDGRSHEFGGEYRGSLVHLQPGTTYEVQVQAETEAANAQFTT